MSKTIWVGVDWGLDHAEVFTEASSSLSGRVPTTREALDQLARDLAGLGDVRVVIEAKTGPIVHALLQAGVRVFLTNPAKVDAARRLRSMSAAKDDRRDAEVLAGLGRLPEALTEVHPEDASVVRLRHASRRYADVGKRRVAAAAQLRAVLQSSFPAVLELGHLDRRWVIRLCALIPSHAAAQTASLSDVAQLLKAGRVRKWDAPTVLELLRETRPPAMGAGEAEAHALDVQLLADQVLLFGEQKRRLRRQLETVLEELEGEQTEGPSEAAIVRSFPGAGTYVASVLLGEGLVRVLRSDVEGARVLSGVAPITSTTGRRQTARRPEVRMRRACDSHLRRAMHLWAEKSIQHCGRSRARYSALRGRGHSHGRALRQLGDSHLRRLGAMLRDGNLYRSAEVVGSPNDGRKTDGRPSAQPPPRPHSKPSGGADGGGQDSAYTHDKLPGSRSRAGRRTHRTPISGVRSRSHDADDVLRSSGSAQRSGNGGVREAIGLPRTKPEGGRST